MNWAEGKADGNRGLDRIEGTRASPGSWLQGLGLSQRWGGETAAVTEQGLHFQGCSSPSWDPGKPKGVFSAFLGSVARDFAFHSSSLQGGLSPAAPFPPVPTL